MKIREYLEKKYRMPEPTTITYQEARAFGVRWPLRNGWLKDFGHFEITEEMARGALEFMGAKPSSTIAAKMMYRERGMAILRDLLAGRITSVPILQPAPEPKKRKKPRRERPAVHPHALDAFLESYEWRRLRMEAIKRHGNRCQCCGASPATGAVINVDHIKPRRLFPELALDINNLQVLCGACNHGKGNWDMTDWREIRAEMP